MDDRSGPPQRRFETANSSVVFPLELLPGRTPSSKNKIIPSQAGLSTDKEPNVRVEVNRADRLPFPPKRKDLQNSRGEGRCSVQGVQSVLEMVGNALLGKGDGLRIRAMKNMGNFLNRGRTMRAFGVRLIPPVTELIGNTNATGGKFPTPSLKAWRKALDSLDTWRPINLGAGGDANVMVSFPVPVDTGHE